MAYSAQVNLTFTGQFNYTYGDSSTLYAGNSNTVLVGSAPFTLKINTASILSYSGYYSGKIYKISYDFGDGTVINDLLTPDSDPVQNGKIHNYYLNNVTSKTFNVKVNLYSTAASTPYSFTWGLNLTAPLIENDIFNQIATPSLSGYFQEIHLIGTRMFGSNDNILYMFETVNPNYVVPVLVNWSAQPTVSVPTVPQVPYRPFRLLSPFENNVTSPVISTDINPIASGGYVNNPDNGASASSIIASHP